MDRRRRRHRRSRRPRRLPTPLRRRRIVKHSGRRQHRTRRRRPVAIVRAHAPHAQRGELTGVAGGEVRVGEPSRRRCIWFGHHHGRGRVRVLRRGRRGGRVRALTLHRRRKWTACGERRRDGGGHRDWSRLNTVTRDTTCRLVG